MLHHLPGAAAIAALLNECVRVSARLVIVEEVTGPNTNIARARAFDSDMNGQPASGRAHAGVRLSFSGRGEGAAFGRRRAARRTQSGLDGIGR